MLLPRWLGVERAWKYGSSFTNSHGLHVCQVSPQTLIVDVSSTINVLYIYKQTLLMAFIPKRYSQCLFLAVFTLAECKSQRRPKIRHPTLKKNEEDASNDRLYIEQKRDTSNPLALQNLPRPHITQTYTHKVSS